MECPAVLTSTLSRSIHCHEPHVAAGIGFRLAGSDGGRGKPREWDEFWDSGLVSPLTTPASVTLDGAARMPALLRL